MCVMSKVFICNLIGCPLSLQYHAQSHCDRPPIFTQQEYSVRSLHVVDNQHTGFIPLSLSCFCPLPSSLSPLSSSLFPPPSLPPPPLARCCVHLPLSCPAPLLPSVHLCLPHRSLWRVLCIWVQESLQCKGQRSLL